MNKTEIASMPGYANMSIKDIVEYFAEHYFGEKRKVGELMPDGYFRLIDGYRTYKAEYIKGKFTTPDMFKIYTIED